jgi:hypothetical protein
MKKAQVWVETVIYTLIAFVLIGTVLFFARPEIQELQDKAVLEQSMNLLKGMNDMILSIVQGGPGNRRIMELGLKRGLLKIDGINDQIIFEMEGEYEYSELGKSIDVGGDITALTHEKGNFYLVTFTSDMSDYNITYAGEDKLKFINPSATSYKISFLNKGKENGKLKIDLEIQ